MIQRLRASDRFLYFILLWCVCSFKVLLGGVGEAGLRVDDLLILITFVILALRGDLWKVPRSEALRAYLIFVLINFVSAAWNGWMGRVEFIYALLFTIRLVEYLVFYYLGYVLLAGGVRIWRGLRIYFYVLCVVVVLQSIRLIPVASKFNAVRASGNTNGPYELAVVAAFFLCYFGYQERKKLSAAAALILLVMTASRVTFIGTAVGFVLRMISRSKTKLRLSAAIAAILLVAWAGSAWIQSNPNTGENAESLVNRLKSSSSSLSLQETRSLWDSVPTYRRAEDYFQGAFIDAGDFAFVSERDASGMIRAYRWAALLKTACSSFDSMIIGLGPSFGSAAVDGYFVRIFIECGLAGLFAFGFFVRALLKRQSDTRCAFRDFVVVVLFTACFIDIFTSYKTMLLLWLWNGMNEFSERQRGDAHSLSDAG